MVLIKPTNARLELPLEQLAAICGKYGVEELSVFGSALRDEFGPDSDVDFLVTFRDDDAGPWFGKYVDMEQDLAALLHRAVDLVSRRAVEQSDNYIRRKHILGTAERIYGA